MERFTFKTPTLYRGVTADAAVAELERIRKKHGTLKPEIVVEESRNKNAILHRCFQWDDAKAAELYRNEQARKLIINIVTTSENESVKCRVRYFMNVGTSENYNRSYIPVTEAIVDDTAYKDLLGQARADMERFIDKYTQIEELGFVKRSMLRTIDYIDRECLQKEQKSAGAA